MIKIGINGIGRIGKYVLKFLISKNVKPEWINDSVGNIEIHRHLLEFDTVHGKWNADFSNNATTISIDESKLLFTGYNKIEELKLDGIDIILDCTGVYKSQQKLKPYFDKGVKKVIVSAPIKEKEVANLVYGVNHEVYNPKTHKVITAASCTTNCLAPIIKVIHSNIGIIHGSITTIHNATNSQTLVDRPGKDLRRSRSSLNSMIPTTTGSASAISLIYPELKGKLNGHAVRVPLLNSSLTDCVFEVKRDTSESEVNNLFKEASKSYLKDILGYEEAQLVSADFVNDERSAVVDAYSTMVINKRQLKVYAWYDNEIAYAKRMVDILEYISASL
ncbi:ArsJ-associated glyceraldehyde-3-phosphate dehydrogenase [Alphaproteobacteria bacterium]|nr:ArsJ-associated glyceraldehyde-3-phosphate dehydrogenase [Alphaproteobacteria bacterium]|tara:strand:+ start:153 stop:1151 length:999 start_codon:yes stop_codon:yes gene_type:complete